MVEFHSSINKPYVSNEVKKTIQNKYRVNFQAYIIRDTMKEVLNLSYKKGKSRPLTTMTSKQIIIKGLFVVRIIKIINKFKILINIDETLFSRATKITHIWSEKGKEWVLNNIWCSSSFTLINVI